MYKEIKEKLMEIEYESLGNAVFEAFMEEDNNFLEIGKSVTKIFMSCESEKDFKNVDGMLTAITGYGISTLLNRTEEEKDK